MNKNKNHNEKYKIYFNNNYTVIRIILFKNTINFHMTSQECNDISTFYPQN